LTSSSNFDSSGPLTMQSPSVALAPLMSAVGEFSHNLDWQVKYLGHFDG